MRLFYALWPDDCVRDALAALQASLSGRAARHANLHLTLAFLGNQPAQRLPQLRAILDRVPAASIDLTLDRLGHFARPRIVWAGASHTPPALTVLHASLSALLAAEGIAFDQSASFKPHVTLARDAPRVDGVFAPIAWRACRLALVESVKDKQGVCYRVLAERDLDR